MSPHQPWHRWILYGFWFAQITTLVYPTLFVIVSSLVRAMTGEPPWGVKNYSLLERICIPVSLALCGFEIGIYNGGRLSPVFYLGSQLFKSVYPALNLYECYQNRCRDISKETIHAITFWAALVYALYIFALHISRRRRHISRSLDTRVMPSDGINSAANLRTDSPALLRLIRWLNTDNSSYTVLPALLDTALRLTVFTAKYIISAVPIFIASSVPSVPGEPEIVGSSRSSRSLVGRLSETIKDWNYLAPSLDDKYRDSYHDGDSANATDVEEDHARDSVGLYAINVPHQSSQPSRSSTLYDLESTTGLITPQYLCFVDETEGENFDRGYSTRKVDDGSTQPDAMRYVFISYTRNQFYTLIPADPTVSAAEKRRYAPAIERDRSTLIRLAIAATREAGVPAFWIDFECIRPEEGSSHASDIEEVYRICDIVRDSHSMAIMLGPALDGEKEHVVKTSKDDWLLGWGNRLWTVPEALLCPSQHDISVYSADSEKPEKIAKRNLANRVWSDAWKLRQLMDFYEGSLPLDPLEHISIALECLHRRQTAKRNEGDVAYALMGLLRLRPKVRKTDTDFEAFARLSLANNSNKLLERLVCLSKPHKDAAWHDMADTWDGKLWNIDPHFQIVSLESNNTIVIDNAFGAQVDWTSLKPVEFTCTGNQRRLSWMFMRLIQKGLLGWLLLYYILAFVFGPAVESMSGDDEMPEMKPQIPRIHLTGTFWTVFFLLTLPFPALLSHHYRQDLDRIQARFFGIEGIPDLGQVEASLFGMNCGRLKHSRDSLVLRGNALSDARSGRIFTLIDTRSNTATTFKADAPPCLAFVGAWEHGILRVLLCSYNEFNRTFVKETVIRLENAALQNMHYLDRFRFSISSAMKVPAQEHRFASFESDRMLLPDVPEFRSLDP